jgi:hypothetical protein
MDTKMEKEFHDLKSKVDEIHRILLGSEHEQEVGIHSRVKRNEVEIKSLQEWKARITYFAYGMVVPASYGIFDIIKSILLTISR